jgi:hypothetical protein
MADIVCPYQGCKHKFESNNVESFVTRGAAAAAGAGAGAWLGAGLGIVGGPGTAIAGTIPGGIIGGVVGWFAVDQFRRCPKCGRVFKT